MPPKIKISLFLSLFFFMMISYLLLLFIYPCCPLALMADFFGGILSNCILLVLSFITIALILSVIIDFFYKHWSMFSWRRARLGNILISEGYITEGVLKKMLKEQNLRFGEVLVKAGRITSSQLDQALAYQKRASKRLGEILRDLGHSTDEDIRWALNKMKRKIGEILRENGFLTDHELQWVLTLQRHGPSLVRRT